MIKPNKIFYSPSKRRLYNNHIKKSTPSSSSSAKRKTIIKNNENLLSNSSKSLKDEDIQMYKKQKDTINIINDTLLFFKSKKFNDSPKKNKLKNNTSYSSIFVDKLKRNQKLKEKNISLKNLLNELDYSYHYNLYKTKNNNIQKNNIINNNNIKNINYYKYLKKENIELNYINKTLKEEYSILKLEEKNNMNINKILLNKNEIKSNIKSLNYSLNKFLNLLSTICDTNPNLAQKNSLKNQNYINKDKNIFFEDKDLNKNGSNIIENNINDNLLYNNIQFTEEGNLNTNENKNINNDNESFDEIQITIPLKQFEKTENSKFKNYKNFGNINLDIKNEKKLFGNNNLINSFAKSLEYNNLYKSKEIRGYNLDKKKYPFQNTNLLKGSLMNKSAKLFHLKSSGTTSNINQNKTNLKFKENNMKNKDNNLKQNGYISKKFSKLFKK